MPLTTPCHPLDRFLFGSGRGPGPVPDPIALAMGSQGKKKKEGSRMLSSLNECPVQDSNLRPAD